MSGLFVKEDFISHSGVDHATVPDGESAMTTSDRRRRLLSMDDNQAAVLAEMIADAYDIDLSVRGQRSFEFHFAHLLEEAGEAFKCWRSSEISETLSADRFGILHPEGLGSELADMIGMAFVIARSAEITFGIDVAQSLVRKQDYLKSKAMAKFVEGR